tara:strand:- start:224 stop:559 length:336 start_codon:yes stop_codon:yes gene_type:complete
MSEVQKKNGMATASLVLGILSIVLFFTSWLAIVMGILAIIFGVVAKNKIKADPDLAHTGGAAKGGIIMGIIGIVIVIIMIIVVAMFFVAVVGNADFSELNNSLRELENLSN